MIHWNKLYKKIKFWTVLVICTVFSALVWAEEPFFEKVDSFTGAKINQSEKSTTTYILSPKESSQKYMVQLVKVNESQASILSSGALSINLSDWKPEKHRESKVIRFHFLDNVNITKLAGKNINIKLAISADKESTGKLFGEGKANDKHYHFSIPFRIGTEKTVLELSKRLSDKLQALWVRLDLITPAKYTISDVSLGEDDGKESAENKIPEGINLLSNGDAEWGFYNTMWNNPMNQSIDGKLYFLGKKLDGCTTFALDDVIKHGGNRSFRCDGMKNASGTLYFAPVPYVIGKKVYFSFYAKAEKKGTQIKPIFFLANGQAYAFKKAISLTTSWEKYQMPVITWGQKSNEDVNCIGDPVNGYGCEYQATMPRFSANGKVWFDDVSYSIGKPAPETPARELNILGKLNHQDGMYRTGDTIEADFILENTTKNKKTYNLSAGLIDFKGDRTNEQELQQVILEPNASRKVSVKLNPKYRGSFSFNFQAIDASTRKAYDYNILGGIIPADDKKIKRIAVDCPAGRNHAPSVPYLDKFGIGSVRLWSSYKCWNDQYIGLKDIPLFKKAGMFVLLNVGFSDRYQRAPADMTETVARWRKDFGPYADQVDSFEILNEPNIWRNRAKPDPAYTDMSSAAYVRALKAANKLFKELNPKASISGPATCHTDVGFTSGVFAAGGGKYLDVITEHPYREHPELPDFDADIKALRKVSGDKSIYSTECGKRFPAIPRDNLLNDIYQKKLAEIMRMYLIALGCGNQMYVNFAWEVAPVGMAWQTFTGGTPENNGMPRPAPQLYSTRAMADILGDAPTLGRIKLGSKYRSYLFDKGSQRVAVIWKFDGPETVVDLSKVPGKSELFDMMGNPLSLNKAPLNQFPVYLVSNASGDAIRAYLSNLDLKSAGPVITASMRVTGMKEIGVKLTNMRNVTLTGSIKIASKTQKFELKQEETKLIPFSVSQAISNSSRLFKAEIKTNNPPSSLMIKKELKAMFAEHTTKNLKMDGDLSDWPAGNATVLTYKDAVASTVWTEDEKKVTADIRTAWNSDNLYIAVTVYKKGFYPTDRQEVWEGDGLQIAFDTICNGVKGAGYADDDFEYGIARQHGKAEVYRRHASSASHDSLGKEIGKLDGSEVKVFIKEYPDKQVYEMAFGRRAVSPFRLEVGNIMNWDLIVNMSNGKKRIGYLELTPGIGKHKDPFMFIPLLLKK